LASSSGFNSDRTRKPSPRTENRRRAASRGRLNEYTSSSGRSASDREWWKTSRCAPTGRIFPFSHSSSIARLISLPVLASKTAKPLSCVVFIRFLLLVFHAEAGRHFVKVPADLFEPPRRDIGPYRHRHILSQSVIPPASGVGQFLPLGLPGQSSGHFTERQTPGLRFLDGTQR